mmetsp:Transcript_37139/g.67199  ORF Transcript_37139/g.67199 Transcript_37139/m.67199 type:complete len:220 (+) Transcript_37139:148-807(+)
MTRDQGPKLSTGLGFQSCKDCGRKRVVVHGQLDNLAIVNDHGVPLRPDVPELGCCIQLHVQSLGQLALCVCEHAHLSLSLLLLSPGLHHKGIVDRYASDHLSAGAHELGGRLDVTRQVLFRAGRREGPGHCKEDTLLPLEQLRDVDNVTRLALIYVHTRKHVALSGVASQKRDAALWSCDDRCTPKPRERRRAEERSGQGKGTRREECGANGATSNHGL